MNVSSHTFVIDLDQGTVTSSLGSYSITKQTEQSIDFTGRSPDGQTLWWGGVDRYAGTAVLTGMHAKKTGDLNKDIVMNFNLTCQRASQLF